jgi:hypothetical protein
MTPNGPYAADPAMYSSRAGSIAPQVLGAPELSEVLLKELSQTTDTLRALVEKASPFLCAEQQNTARLQEQKDAVRPISIIGNNIRQAIDQTISIRHEIEAVIGRLDR